MIAVVEKCKENKEEARFLLESAPLEGSNNADYLKGIVHNFFIFGQISYFE